jgi:hypothetical protein
MEQLFDGIYPMNYKANLLTVMKGFLDESHHKDVFTFCGLLAKGPTWGWFINDWLTCIDSKNRELEKAGRKQLSRYHASDCSNRYKEFKGWGVDEQINFTKQLIGVFRKPANGLTVFSFSLSLGQLQEVIPESSPDPIAFAYVLMLMFLMDEIHTHVNEANDGNVSMIRIPLVHERCDYNGTLQRGFDTAKKRLRKATIFPSLVPMGWEDCPPLQPTDLLAFETCKETERTFSNARPDMRQVLKAILYDTELAGRCSHFSHDGLVKFRDWLTPELKQQILLDANLAAKQQGL